MSKKYPLANLLKLCVVAIICLTFIFFSSSSFFAPIRGFFLHITYPLQKTAYLSSKKINNFCALLSSISSLKKENEYLLKENRQLLARLADSESQKKENEILRKELELTPRQKYSLEAAFVIGQDPRGPGSWIMIDKGRESGLEMGMPVIVAEGVLVGKVEEVYEKSSKVILLTDSTSRINALDVNTEAKGILSGEYGLGMTLGMVAQTDVLNVGDDIITSGLGNALPKGLLIGKIQQIENTPDRLFQQALVRALVQPNDLDVVAIIKNSL